MGFTFLSYAVKNSSFGEDRAQTRWRRLGTAEVWLLSVRRLLPIDSGSYQIHGGPLSLSLVPDAANDMLRWDKHGGRERLSTRDSGFFDANHVWRRLYTPSLNLTRLLSHFSTLGSRTSGATLNYIESPTYIHSRRQITNFHLFGRLVGVPYRINPLRHLSWQHQHSHSA
jgi:hypothetical protein